MLSFRLFLIITCTWLSIPASVSHAAESYEVVVYGGTSAGVAASLQATRMGKSVILIEPGRHLGGLTSGGLGATDIGNKKAIGGIARDFYRRLEVITESRKPGPSNPTSPNKRTGPWSPKRTCRSSTVNNST